MSTAQTPLTQHTIIIRPDLTFVVVSGDDVIEFHFSPEEALEICDALEEYAVAAMVTSQLEAKHDANHTIIPAPGTAPS